MYTFYVDHKILKRDFKRIYLLQSNNLILYCNLEQFLYI